MPIPMQKSLTFTTPEAIRTAPATHLVASPLPGRCLLSFFEALPPIVVGATEAEQQAAWAKIDTIPATCVARILVSEQDLTGFIQVLQAQQAQMKQQGLQGYKSFT